eukprot:scaffold23.g4115.t1
MQESGTSVGRGAQGGGGGRDQAEAPATNGRLPTATPAPDRSSVVLEVKDESVPAEKHAGGAGGGAGSEGGAAAASGSSKQRAAKPVVLRIDVATKAQARALTIAVSSLMLMCVLLTIVQLVLRSEYKGGVGSGRTVADLRPLWAFQLSISVACLALLLVAGLMFGLAAGQATLAVAGYADTLAAPGCAWPLGAAAACSFARWILFTFIMLLHCLACVMNKNLQKFMLWLLALVHSLCLWRGKRALEMQAGDWGGTCADFMLLMDRPMADRARANAPVAALWLLFAVAAVLALVSQARGRMRRTILLFALDWPLARRARRRAVPARPPPRRPLAQGTFRRVSSGAWDVSAAGSGSGTGAGSAAPASFCEVPLDQLRCPQKAYITAEAVAVTALVVWAVLVVTYSLTWRWWLWRARRDHTLLPYNRYKVTNAFIRVQSYLMTPVLISIVIALVGLEGVGDGTDECWASFDKQLGNLPAQISFTVAAFALAILYMPRSTLLDPSVEQDFFQQFAWTRAELGAAVAARNAALAEAHAADEAAAPEGQAVVRVLHRAFTLLPRGRQAAGHRGPDQEPMFCMDTALRLFYWSRLAYTDDANQPASATEQAQARGGVEQPTSAKAAQAEQPPGTRAAMPVPEEEPPPGKHPPQQTEEPSPGKRDLAARAARGRKPAAAPETPAVVLAEVALPMFGLEEYQTLWDGETDTHCWMGWSGEDLAIAFRQEAKLEVKPNPAMLGTKSLQNVMTDVKAWKTPHLPARRHGGRLVEVHAGFYGAWTRNGFSRRVLRRVREVVAAAGGGGMRIWITGHSLGGALAQLAAFEVARQHPDAAVACYTFGCPRVGNSAFAAEYGEAVPDTWGILNGEDPIPWVPKIGFKRCGHRAAVNIRGDLILRPSYFELSMIYRGTSTRDHMTYMYALSLAAVLRAQFVPSKRLPGGEAGVRALAAALDVGAALVLHHCDVASLADAGGPPPAPADRQVAASVQRQGLGGALATSQSAGGCGGCCCGGFGAVGQKRRREGSAGGALRA